MHCSHSSVNLNLGQFRRNCLAMSGAMEKLGNSLLKRVRSFFSLFSYATSCDTLNNDLNAIVSTCNMRMVFVCAEMDRNLNLLLNGAAVCAFVVF